MRSTWRGILAVGTTLLVSGVLASACGSDDSGGGTSTGGKDGGGGSGGSTGGSGGSGGSTGGSGGSTGGSGGCQPAPDPNSTNACDVCQDTDHAECACDTEITACLGDAECSAIWDCIGGDNDAGIAACPTSFDEAGAACVNQCAALHPTGKAMYMAMEKCMYCTYCGAACDTAAYCTALDKPADGGTTDGGSDATTDSATDSAAGDSATD